MSALTVHIGQRIRLYRKAKNLTLEQLAARILKSKSSVAKYESGDIAIDIETLCDIAEALEIELQQLLDMDQRSKSRALFEMPQGFFSRASRFYLYCLNKNSTQVMSSVLEINSHSEGDCSTVLYWGVKNYDNLFQCRHLYYGDLLYSDSYVNLVMQNQTNRAERAFLNIANPLGQSTVTVGMISGTSGKYMVPISLKLILSLYKIPVDGDLLDSLKFTKEDFRLMKQTCCFSVDRLYEPFEK